MALKKLKPGEKIKEKFVLTQLKKGSIVIPAKNIKKLEEIERKEKIKLK